MKIGIVIVTYNRNTLLKKALSSINEQTYLCKYVIVVDNNSNDGTSEFLEKWKNESSAFDKCVISLNENIGGSGGYYEGMKKALDLDADWIFVFDDDAVLEPNCLEQLNEYVTNNNCDDLSAICIAVKNKDGKYEIDHRSTTKSNGFHIYRYSVSKDRYDEEYLYIDALSFVGSLINMKAIREVGLPIRNFFIWYDDFEYSIRLKKYGKILFLPKMYITHYDDINTGILYWKRYYGIRNYLYILKKHFKFIYFLNMCRYIIMYIPRLFINKGKKDNKLINDAYYDAFYNKLGINKNYFPNK